MQARIKKLTSVICTAAALSVAPMAARAQIPVTVTTQVTDSPMTILEFAENTARWAQQVAQMKSQLENMEQQYAAITGARGMTELLNNPTARQFLPEDMQDILEATGELTDKYKAAGRLLKDNAWQDAAMEAAKHLSNQESSAATDLANSETTYKRAGERIDEYQDFVDQIDESTDPKAIQDLQARIQSEQVFLQNETVRLQSMQLAQQAKRDMQAVREKEMLVNMGIPSGIDHSSAFE